MRRWNAVISGLILILFLVHAIAGGYQLLGIIPGGQTTLEYLAWAMAALIAVHLVLGCILTAQTLRSCKKAGVSYFRENQLFWIRRISGFVILLLIAYHIAVFWATGTSPFRLHDFGGVELAGSLLLIAALVLHVLCNIRPLVIALGAAVTGKLWKDLLVVLAAVLLFCTLSFLFYYFRWNLLWNAETLWKWNSLWQ